MRVVPPEAVMGTDVPVAVRDVRRQEEQERVLQEPEGKPEAEAVLQEPEERPEAERTLQEPEERPEAERILQESEERPEAEHIQRQADRQDIRHLRRMDPPESAADRLSGPCRLAWPVVLLQTIWSVQRYWPHWNACIRDMEPLRMKSGARISSAEGCCLQNIMTAISGCRST